jgi:hypothetical protein
VTSVPVPHRVNAAGAGNIGQMRQELQRTPRAYPMAAATSLDRLRLSAGNC